MPATKACPSCSQPIEIVRDQIGASLICPNCGRSISIKQRTAPVAQPEMPSESQDWLQHLRQIASSLRALLRIAVGGLRQMTHQITYAEALSPASEATPEILTEVVEAMPTEIEKRVALWNPRALGWWSIPFTW